MDHEHKLKAYEFIFSEESRKFYSEDAIKIMQGDHNSNIFVFRMPRFIQGHDMLPCTSIEVNYINIGSSAEKSEGVYSISDAAVDEADADMIVMSWILSGNTSKYAGTLSFQIHFECMNGEELEYAWHTDSFTLAVSDSIDSSDSVYEVDADILAQWEARMEALLKEIEEGTVGGGTNDYEKLKNQPQINGNELVGNKTNEDLGIPTKTSELQNDSGFATKSYVDSEIATFDFIKQVEVDLTDYVKNTDIATTEKAGIVKPDTKNFFVTTQGLLTLIKAFPPNIMQKSGDFPIPSKYIDLVVKCGLIDNVNSLTEDEQQKIKNWLGVKESKIIYTSSMYYPSEEAFATELVGNMTGDDWTILQNLVFNLENSAPVNIIVYIDPLSDTLQLNFVCLGSMYDDGRETGYVYAYGSWEDSIYEITFNVYDQTISSVQLIVDKNQIQGHKYIYVEPNCYPYEDGFMTALSNELTDEDKTKIDSFRESFYRNGTPVFALTIKVRLSEMDWMNFDCSSMNDDGYIYAIGSFNGATYEMMIDVHDGYSGTITNISSMPQATQSQLGGIKAKEKTTESVEVAIDRETGKLFVPEIFTSRIEMTTADTDVELDANTFYVFPKMSTINITLATPTDTTIVNEYHFLFTSGETATTLTIPDTVYTPDGFTIEANKIYEISIVESNLLFNSWVVETNA